MSSKRIALVIAKFGFCVAAAVMLWTGSANANSFIPCPPSCKPAGTLHCICP